MDESRQINNVYCHFTEKVKKIQCELLLFHLLFKTCTTVSSEISNLHCSILKGKTNHEKRKPRKPIAHQLPPLYPPINPKQSLPKMSLHKKIFRKKVRVRVKRCGVVHLEAGAQETYPLI